jgi:predicted transposase/invertase (TIGR01784 family)
MIEEYHQEELQQTKFEEGIKEGKQEGIKEGEKKKALQIARKLLTTGGLDVQSIAAMTDLSEEEVASLARSREDS